jgi:hypothetical protein
VESKGVLGGWWEFKQSSKGYFRHLDKRLGGVRFRGLTAISNVATRVAAALVHQQPRWYGLPELPVAMSSTTGWMGILDFLYVKQI